MLLSPPAFGLFLFWSSFSLPFFFSGFLLLLSLSISLLSLYFASSSSSSVLCLWFYHVLGVIPFLLWFFVLLPLVLEAGCWRRWSTPVLVSVLSSDGLSLRLLCAFVRWVEMKGQRRSWGCSLSLRRSSAFLSGFSSAQDEGDGDKSMTFCRLNVSSLWFFSVFILVSSSSVFLFPILGSALSCLSCFFIFCSVFLLWFLLWFSPVSGFLSGFSFRFLSPWFFFFFLLPALSHLLWLYSQRMPSISTIETASKPLLQKPFLWKETKKAMADF